MTLDATGSVSPGDTVMAHGDPMSTESPICSETATDAAPATFALKVARNGMTLGVPPAGVSDVTDTSSNTSSVPRRITFLPDSDSSAVPTRKNRARAPLSLMTATLSAFAPATFTSIVNVEPARASTDACTAVPAVATVTVTGLTVMSSVVPMVLPAENMSTPTTVSESVS